MALNNTENVHNFIYLWSFSSNFKWKIHVVATLKTSAEHEEDINE